MNRRVSYLFVSLLLIVSVIIFSTGSTFRTGLDANGRIVLQSYGEYQFSEPISNRLLALPNQTVTAPPSISITEPCPSFLYGLRFWKTPQFIFSVKNRITSTFKEYLREKGGNEPSCLLLEKRLMLYVLRSLII